LPVDELQHIAAMGGGRYVTVNEAGALIDGLRALHSLPSRDYEVGQRVSAWQNAGIWLLPPLLLLVPLLARRGWL